MYILKYIKWFFQKIFLGYCDKDFWSLDYTFAKFILPRLQRFRKMNRMGYPSCLKEDEEKCEVGMKRWNEILDKMIYAFKYVLNDYCIFEKDLHVWDTEYKKICKLTRKRYKEGMYLFHKYFASLWD